MPAERAEHGSDQHLDMLGYLAVLWKHKWLILIIAGITTLTATVVSLRQATAYTSTVRILVKPTALNPPGSIPMTQTVNLATEAEVARSQPVATAAAEVMDDSTTPAQVLARTTAAPVPDTQVLMLTYAAPTPEGAAGGAQSVAEAYLDYRSRQAKEGAEKVIADASATIAKLRLQAEEANRTAAAAGDRTEARAEALMRAQELMAQVTIWEANVAAINTQAIDAGQILVSAGVPSAPASPKPAQAALRGLLLGLLLGIAAALFLDATQRRKRVAV